MSSGGGKYMTERGGRNERGGKGKERGRGIYFGVVVLDGACTFEYFVLKATRKDNHHTRRAEGKVQLFPCTWTLCANHPYK